MKYDRYDILGRYGRYHILRYGKYGRYDILGRYDKYSRYDIW